jgi:hypothetical protein
VRWRDLRVDPRCSGCFAIRLEPGAVVRLTAGDRPRAVGLPRDDVAL